MQGAISKALGASYSAVEEAKADVMGVYNVLYMIQVVSRFTCHVSQCYTCTMSSS